MKITDGFSAETNVEYSALVSTNNNGKPLYSPDSVKPNFPQAPANRSMQVVKNISVSNGVGGYNNRYFNYSGGKMDLQGRGFLGFASITITDEAAGIVNITDFNQAYPFVGRVTNAITQTTDGNLISSVKNTYAVHPKNARLPFLDVSVQQSYQLLASADTPLAVTKTKNTFDYCGNLTDQVTTIGTGFDGVNVTGELSAQQAVNEVNYYSTDVCSDDFVTKHSEIFTKTTTAEIQSAITELTPNSAKDIATKTVLKGTSIESITTYSREANGVVNGIEVSAKDIDGSALPMRKTLFVVVK